MGFPGPVQYFFQQYPWQLISFNQSIIQVDSLDLVDFVPNKDLIVRFGLNCTTKVSFILENVHIVNFFLQNEDVCTEKLDQEVALVERQVLPLYNNKSILNLRCPTIGPISPCEILKWHIRSRDVASISV